MNHPVDNSSGARRKLAAIMFTDMVGYSALMQRDEDLAMRLLDEHRAVLRGIFPLHGGEEIETIGDAFLVEFGSAINAVRCALAIQAALAAGNSARPPGEALTLRIGIHLGDIVRREGRVYGDGVNVASRVQEEAAPGEVLVSDDVARQVRNVPDIPLTPVGKRTLKNIASPVALFRAGDGPASAPPEASAGAAHRSPKSRALMFAAATLTVIVAAAVLLFVLPAGPPAVTRNSVAVLPFRNIGTDRDDAYLAEGMTEAVILQLSRIRSLRVINSKTSSHFRSGEYGVGEVASKLGVQTILEGSLRRDRENVTITVSLTDPVGEQLWGERYTRVNRETSLLIGEIARGVAGGLRQQFFGRGDAAPRGVSQSYADAYDLYLKGRYRWNRRSAADVAAASRLFGEAIGKDSSFAPAWVGLADCYTFYGSPEYGVLPPDSVYPRAEAAVKRAIALDESLPEAHATLASIYFNYYWEWGPAERHFRRAIELNPNDATTYSWYADCLTALGRFDEARASVAEALSRDPLSLNVRASAGVKLYYSGKSDSALAVFRKIRWTDSTFVPVYLWLGLTLTDLGRYEEALGAVRSGIAMAGRSPVLIAGEAYVAARMGDAGRAREILAELRNLSWEFYVSPYYFGEIHHALGEDDEAFAWFERAVLEKSGAVVYMKVSPTLVDLRGSPRFQALLASTGLE